MNNDENSRIKITGRVKASAPGKIIISGEHAVVHGKPAIAGAISSRVYTTLEEGEGILSIPQLNIDSPLDSEGSIFAFFRRGFELLKKKPLTIKIDCDFPIGAGLGSSAAMACSFLKALEPDLTNERIQQLAHEMEKIVHGNPSGVDTAISTNGGLIRFQSGEIMPLPVRNLPILVGYTRMPGNTKKTVSKVQKLLEEKPETKKILDNIEDITLRCEEAILRGNQSLLGELLTENHELLRELGVSTPELDRLVKVALKAGALGAKLTGGGGGGCIIALSGEEKVVEAIRNSGGTVIKTRLSDAGVRWENIKSN